MKTQTSDRCHGSIVFSLLWPEGKRPEDAGAGFVLTDAVKRDLELENLFLKIAGSERGYFEMAPILCQPSSDPEVLAYRQDVTADLLASPALCRCFEELAPSLEALRWSGIVDRELKNDLYDVTMRLSELEAYIRCVARLLQVFEAAERPPASAGLISLRETALAVDREETFQRLKAELPGLLSALRGIRSVSIGVNLDHNLLPYEAALTAVNKEKFTEKSGNLLKRLFGDKVSDSECLTPLHRAPYKEIFLNYRKSFRLDPELFGHAVNPLMVPLFNDLNNLLKKTAAPVAMALKRYTAVHTNAFWNLRPEIAFYTGACKLINTLKAAGLPFTRPELRPPEERVCRVKNAFNLNLALNLLQGARERPAETIVKNDINFDAEGRVLILTGPNRGGKTVYAQSIGLCHVLAQLGLPVPAEEAVLSPVDGIFTHFPTEEKIEGGTGRLGDEAKRLDEIFADLTPNGLLLLNESLSSTSADEGYYIAWDFLRVLVRLGVRCVFTTHLHALAADVDKLNRECGDGGKARCLAALTREEAGSGGSKAIIRTFRIEPGPPAGLSYARETAERYGVSYEQLCGKLRKRGLIQ